jgi:CRP-like cAMP-binding protein
MADGMVEQTGQPAPAVTARCDKSSAALERFLHRLDLRSRLGDSDRQAILALPGRLVAHDAHRDIVRPGQLLDYATLIVSGLAARFDRLADGSRQTTAIHIPGDMADLHSVPVPQAGWGIEALIDTDVLEVPHTALRALAEERPTIAFALWRDSIVDASILAKWISALGRRSAAQRLAHFYCEMGIRFEQAGLGARDDFVLPMTQMQLAEVLGVTAVHLNRSLQSLRAQGLIRTEGRRLQVIDVTALRAVADFDPRYLLLDPA